MIVSGHIHIFEASTFGDKDPKRPTQVVVGTGGDKLAKKPDDPSDVDGVTVTDARILRSFGYMVWDGDGVSWNGMCSMLRAIQSHTAGWRHVI